MHPDDEQIETSKEPYNPNNNGNNNLPVKPRAWYSPTVKKFASLVTFIAIVFMLVANGTTSWAKYTISGVTVDVGLWSTCIDDGQGCTYNDWSGYAICGLTPEDIRNRFHSIIALGIVGSLFGIVYLLAAHCPRVKTGLYTFIRFLSLFFLVVSFVGVIGIFLHTWNKWYFCGGDVCDYFFSIGAQDCESKYSYSFFLAIIGMPFAVIALILNFVSLCRSRVSVDKDGKVAPTTVPASQDEIAPEQFQPTGKYEVPEGGDWRFDPNSGFWWSDSHHLYFNDSTGHYYDPEEESWFDPATGEWS